MLGRAEALVGLDIVVQGGSQGEGEGEGGVVVVSVGGSEEVGIMVSFRVARGGT